MRAKFYHPVLMICGVCVIFSCLRQAFCARNDAVRLSVFPSGGDRTLYNYGSQGFVLWPEGQPLNLSCVVEMKDPSSKNYKTIEETEMAESTTNRSLTNVVRPQYQINWYLPDRRLLDDGGSLHMEDVNHVSLIIQETRSIYSGVYKCSANNQDPNDSKFPPSLIKEVSLRVLTNSDGRAPSCAKNFFQCHNNIHHCISRRYLCDGVPDCLDGSDESVEECGLGDPCAGKLRCEDHRCMDPSQCCDPSLDPSCLVVQDCCLALIESGRQFYKLGIERRNSQDLKLLHSTIYTVTGCVVAFLIIMMLVTIAVCRLQAKRGGMFLRYSGRGGVGGLPRGASRSHPPITLHDLDVYFASLRRVDSRRSLTPAQAAAAAASGHHGITYNINNGVQIVGAPALPPPYSAAPADPPPPYIAAVGPPPHDNEAEIPLLEEDNNNGDINGNSDQIDFHLQHNLVHQQQQQQQQQQILLQQPHQIHAIASLDIHPVPAAVGPASPLLPEQPNRVAASPLSQWHARQVAASGASSSSSSSDGSLTTSRGMYVAAAADAGIDDNFASSSDSE